MRHIETDATDPKSCHKVPTHVCMAAVLLATPKEMPGSAKGAATGV